MLTEKGLNDSVWCPVLWKETEGNKKRFQSFKGDDDSWDLIRRALTTESPNKRCGYEEYGYTKKAVPYGNALWCPFLIDEIYLLLTFKEIQWEMRGGYVHVTLVRSMYRPLKYEDKIQAESNIRILVADYVSQNIFPEVDEVHVISDDGENQFITNSSDIVDSLYQESLAWLTQIQAYARGEEDLPPNHFRCQYCWWKECPDRKSSKAKPGITRNQLL